MEKTRARLLREIAGKGGIYVSCPNCGTALLIRAGQRSGICYGCCQAVDLAAAERNALAQTAQDGISGYPALLSLAGEQLSLSSYAAAAETYSTACAIDPDCGAAWRGMLAALTENFQKEMRPPQDLYEKAVSRLPAPEAAKLQDQWTAYTGYLAGCEENRRQRGRTEQAQQRNREQQAQAEAGAAAEKKGWGRAIARTLIISACIAGGLLLLLTGSGFMIIMGAAILSALGRGRGDNGR